MAKKKDEENWKQKTLYLGAERGGSGSVWNRKPKYGKANFEDAKGNDEGVGFLIGICALSDLCLSLKPGELCKVTIQKIKAEKV